MSRGYGRVEQFIVETLGETQDEVSVPSLADRWMAARSRGGSPPSRAVALSSVRRAVKSLERKGELETGYWDVREHMLWVWPRGSRPKWVSNQYRKVQSWRALEDYILGKLMRTGDYESINGLAEEVQSFKGDLDWRPSTLYQAVRRTVKRLESKGEVILQPASANRLRVVLSSPPGPHQPRRRGRSPQPPDSV